MPTIYLDACCLNRPFDEPSQDRVRLESEAVLIILGHVEAGEWPWITSEPLMLEISQNPNAARRLRVTVMTEIATRYVAAGEKERERATQVAALGFRPFDALHIACAESSSADVLLTTDDQMVQRAERLSGQLKVRVANPLVWLKEIS